MCTRSKSRPGYVAPVSFIENLSRSRRSGGFDQKFFPPVASVRDTRLLRPRNQRCVRTSSVRYHTCTTNGPTFNFTHKSIYVDRVRVHGFRYRFISTKIVSALRYADYDTRYRTVTTLSNDKNCLLTESYDVRYVSAQERINTKYKKN